MLDLDALMVALSVCLSACWMTAVATVAAEPRSAHMWEQFAMSEHNSSQDEYVGGIMSGVTHDEDWRSPCNSAVLKQTQDRQKHT